MTRLRPPGRLVLGGVRAQASGSAAHLHARRSEARWISTHGPRGWNPRSDPGAAGPALLGASACFLYSASLWQPCEETRRALLGPKGAPTPSPRLHPHGPLPKPTSNTVLCDSGFNI